MTTINALWGLKAGRKDYSSRTDNQSHHSCESGNPGNISVAVFLAELLIEIFFSCRPDHRGFFWAINFQPFYKYDRSFLEMSDENREIAPN